MKQIRILFLSVCICFLFGCTPAGQSKTVVAATTYPVYQFTAAVCDGTELQVIRLVSEPVSCLHDYTITVDQMRNLEKADVVVCSGAGIDAFALTAMKSDTKLISCDQGLTLLDSPEEEHEDEETQSSQTHALESDPHYWLDPSIASKMVQTIADGLAEQYPDDADTFRSNAAAYQEKLASLQAEGQEMLQNLKNRELITFHDGFEYFARTFDLDVLVSIEEEAGSEASAADLKDISALIQAHSIPAIFTETNGSSASAETIARETGVKVFDLDLGMGQRDYFAAMEHNLQTIKEALG